VPVSWSQSNVSRRLLNRVEKSVEAAAKQATADTKKLHKLRHAGLELRVRAQLGWRMVHTAVITELTPLGAGWFAPCKAKQPKLVSAPVAAASVSLEERVRQLTAELSAERACSEQLRVDLAASQREHTRALRRVASAQGEADTEGQWAALQVWQLQLRAGTQR